MPHRDLLPTEHIFQGGCFGLSDGFYEHLEAGHIIMKPQIDHLTPVGAVFQDGSCLENLDVIVFATGYYPDYDVIDIQGITG